jgi:hypothetical protein
MVKIARHAPQEQRQRSSNVVRRYNAVGNVLPRSHGERNATETVVTAATNKQITTVMATATGTATATRTVR